MTCSKYMEKKFKKFNYRSIIDNNVIKYSTGKSFLKNIFSRSFPINVARCVCMIRHCLLL